jgi:Zn-finger nucleic acid-binding protein
MTSYDLFIKGIHPDSLDEAEHIKKKASQHFKIDVNQLELLWNAPSGFCIRRSINQEEANQIQNTLTLAGLICLKIPSLSLIEKTESTEDFTCPYCKIKIKLDNDDQEPLQCPECSGIIAKYAETQERIEIRNRLINSKAFRDRAQLQLSKSEAERIRKQTIEDEIKQELFGVQKIRSNTNLLIAGSAAILITLAATYLLIIKEDKKTDATTVLPADTSAAIALSGEAPPQTYASGGPVGAQTTLQDTHDKANKVLGAFGLDADKIGKNAGNATAPIKLVSNSSNGDALIAIAKTNAPESDFIAVTIALLHDSENNQEWDLFLNQHITSFLEREKIEEAYKVAQYIVDTETYIHTMGLLLAHAQQINQGKQLNDIEVAIGNRINSLPISNQVEYLAQAGFDQLRISKKDELLNRSETVWKQIPNSDDQLKAALKIAVYNFKSGNIKTANNYFSLAHKLLEKNKSPDQQVNARAALCRAYYDVNESDNASKWLASTETFLQEVTLATLKELIGSYAYTNQWQTTTLQNIAIEKQSELLYVAVQVSLKNNALNNALNFNKNIQDPIYNVLASGLIASYDPSNASSTLDIAEKQLHTISCQAIKPLLQVAFQEITVEWVIHKKLLS